jgi:hypothetical protein
MLVQRDVVVSIPRTESGFAAILENEASLEVATLEGAGNDGGGELIVLLIPLVTLTVNKLIELLKAHWDRAKNVKLEVDGMSITGASLSEVSEFLERNLSNRRLPPKTDGQ